ncbi:Epi-isozizaene synthase [Actinomadura rubteroloni]|uniref:Terpene synthase n=1 Tax=Actinomadura rubteroloni TaxID=1926885 RepID=A0A2P4UQM5_9ACTN|nr:terpene synthase family protein [Actinomadura rubteroloni]POM27340.1 Epi-isozizaene synthase [Actinomadura rubteroloni]
MHTSTTSTPPPGEAGQAGWVLNDQAVLVERHALDWLHRFDLTPDPETRARVERINAGAAFAMLFPQAPADVLELAGDVMVWITAFGDVLVDGCDRRTSDLARLTLHLNETLHATTSRSVAERTGFVAALEDLLTRSSAILPNRHHTRLVKALTAFIGAQNWHVDTESAASPPSVEDYLVARRHTVAAWSLVALLEPLEHSRFPAEIHDVPEVGELNTAACTLLACVNDLASHRKERRSGDTAITLPTLLMHERQCSLDESISVISAMCEADTARAHEIIAQLKASHDRHVSEYGELVGNLVGYFASWHTVVAADRYR